MRQKGFVLLWVFIKPLRNSLVIVALEKASKAGNKNFPFCY